MAGSKILLADDDELILTTLSGGLKQAGYHVVTASNGEEAVRVGNQEKPDLAVLDIRMPGMFGIEAARQLRQQSDIDSIFLTAYSDREIVEMATKEGALGYLVKPVDIHQLVPSIEAALERSAELRRLHNSENNLVDAIQRNREISVAIGICMERFRITEQQAFENLRNFARSQRRKLLEVAGELVRVSDDHYDLLNQIDPSAKR